MRAGTAEEFIPPTRGKANQELSVSRGTDHGHDAPIPEEKRSYEKAPVPDHEDNGFSLIAQKPVRLFPLHRDPGRPHTEPVHQFPDRYEEKQARPST